MTKKERNNMLRTKANKALKDMKVERPQALLELVQVFEFLDKQKAGK